MDFVNRRLSKSEADVGVKNVGVKDVDVKDVDVKKDATRSGLMMQSKVAQPTQEQAENAVRTLFQWAGDDPGRECLRETPARVTRAFLEWFKGYDADPVDVLQRTFEEVEGYDEVVVLRDIRYESYCEHHMAPIIGVAHVGYLPTNRVVGISKLARVVEIYAKRLQVQEKMTAQIAKCVHEVLRPKGVAVVVEGEHHCMSTRGVHKPGVTMVTSQMIGIFRENENTRREFLSIIGNPVNRGV